MRRDEARSPWRTLGSRNVYENPWISVREDSVIRPDGESGIYGVVHYKNTAVGVLPVEEDHVYLVGQYRYPLGRYSWEIPEGGCPEAEEPLRAAKRELREETGLEARNWRMLGEAYLSTRSPTNTLCGSSPRGSYQGSSSRKGPRLSACDASPCARPSPWRGTEGSPMLSASSR